MEGTSRRTRTENFGGKEPGGPQVPKAGVKAGGGWAPVGASPGKSQIRENPCRKILSYEAMLPHQCVHPTVGLRSNEPPAGIRGAREIKEGEAM